MTTTIDRTPKPCLHPKANHQHGTLAKYCLDRCRCLPCAFAASLYGEGMRERMARGESRLCSPSKARAHIKLLCASGWTYRGIANESGVGLSTVERIARGYHRQKTIRSSIAERVLAVPPKFFTDRSVVRAYGAQRRLHALAALGWTLRAMAAQSGIRYNTLINISNGTHQGCLVTTYVAVSEMYDALWDKTPEPTSRHDAGIVARTRKQAARNGWTVPMSWDDDAIDDPNAQPDTTGMPQVSRDHPRHQQILALHGQGLSDRKIAAAIGVTGDAVRYWRMRIGLTPNTPGRSTALGDEPDDRYRLWQDGHSDQQIADKTGKHPDLIRKWRRRHGLEASGRWPAA